MQLPDAEATLGWDEPEHTEDPRTWLSAVEVLDVRFLNRSGQPRFRVEDRGYVTPCWVWQMCKDKRTGYGKISNGLAHRWVYSFFHPLPPQLDHLCRQRDCVNPDHLEPVTHAENGRRGASAKLTKADVAQIKERIAQGDDNVSIATDYGVGEPAIWKIAHGFRWA